ncbi:MAG TPA: OadG family protein [Candidatus Halomonas stercoripullorum]|uniref:Probable oxaloacetate decarboxylase gamma chain n=1 Tax=Candidatus Halomonas stercoripullorum TaxID=2838617 RepID=A0A9D1WLH0_9GAMM|nr:OadG family protein [Candidatus Halomonas stercoripullorum]
MRDTQLLLDGLVLTGVGIGFVFVFLTLLVASMTLMSLLLRRLASDPLPLVTPKPASPLSDTELVAVISTAVHRYRRHKRR